MLIQGLPDVIVLEGLTVPSDFSVGKAPCFHCLSDTQEKLKAKATGGLYGMKVQSFRLVGIRNRVYEGCVENVRP